MSKQKFVDYVNYIWIKYIDSLSPVNHIFLTDMNNVRDYTPIKKITPDNNLNFSMILNKIKNNTRREPSRYLPKKLIFELFDELMSKEKIPMWSNLEHKLSKFQKYLLYSNIIFKDYSKILRSKNSDTLNIMILGAGPTGLYIANYINKINLISPKINLIIIDKKSTPYSRNRIYGINFNLFSSFLPNFSCMSNLIKKGGIRIKYLENILITLTYGYKIPIYFTDKIINEQSLKKFVSKNKIDIVFDCTGGRFKNNFIAEPLTNLINSKINLATYKYQIIKTGNDLKLDWLGHINKKYYIGIEIYTNNKYTQLPFYNIAYQEDYDALSVLNNKCVTVSKSIIKYFSILSDIKLEKYIVTIVKKYINRGSTKIKFYVFETKICHKLNICGLINDETIYVGAGDTIFSSHFLLGAGLNRLLNFTNYVIWYIQNLSKY